MLTCLLLWLWCGVPLALATPTPAPSEASTLVSGPSAPAEPAVDLATIEDPRRLEALGEQALAAGDRGGAKRLFELMLERMEVSRYLDYRADLRDALVLERLGEADEATALYRASFATDVMRTILVLRILSAHPDREALVAEGYAHARALVEQAERGEPAVVYVTNKGEPRHLEILTQEELLSPAKGGRAQYCYVASLDLGAVPQDRLPERIQLDRCILGRVKIPAKSFGAFALRGLVLGDADFGKTWEGVPNKSKTVPPSSFRDLVVRETLFAGRANFAGVTVTEGRALFPMAVFEGEADFKGAEFWGDTDFRFASFGAGANFKNLRMHAPVYFGGTRYRADTIFTGVYSERDVYFNGATFEGDVTFDKCEFERGATFEDSRFHGRASLASSKIALDLNLGRAVFRGPVDVKNVELGALDALGAHFAQQAWFMDAVVEGRTRFSLDEVTRHAVREGLDASLPLYRRYQGDEDADAPLTTKSSYGVTAVEDLNARIDGDISFANSVFGGYTVFEGVQFGQPGQPSVASFFNAQFLGETHFERTTWYGQADFTTIFGSEVAFNDARFHRSLILDDAAIAGRLTLTNAELVGAAELSFFGAELASFQIDPAQLAQEDGYHKLFYERCAFGAIDRADVRIERILRGESLDDLALRDICYANVVDEFVALKQSYGDRAMTTAEDEAYWWARHHKAVRDFEYATNPVSKLWIALVDLALFELCLGWGVQLGNLAIAVVFTTLIYAVLYRVLCPDTVLQYDGDDIAVKDVPFFGLCYISLQSMIGANTGWDFGADDFTFRVLNTAQMLTGFILMTFFVGAYTRQILA